VLRAGSKKKQGFCKQLHRFLSASNSVLQAQSSRQPKLSGASASVPFLDVWSGLCRPELHHSSVLPGDHHSEGGPARHAAPARRGELRQQGLIWTPVPQACVSVS